MNLIKFLFSKLFIRNLVIAGCIFILVIVSSLIWLRIYTHHSQSFTVPDFTGLYPEEVDIVAKSKKLRIEIADSSFMDDLPKGTIIRQNPFPGSKVKENRRIYLTLNAVNPEMVIMPNVTGVSLRQAKAILETYGLSVGKISYKPDIAVNNVLEQKMNDTLVTPGNQVIKGSPVNLLLGMGLSTEKTLVPDLTGMNIMRAKGLLIDRYLNVGAVIYDNNVVTNDDSINAFIWRQRPEIGGGSMLNLGSNIDIWLTTDSTKIPVPEHIIEKKVNENSDEVFEW